MTRDEYLRECADNVSRALEVAESGSRLEFDILLKAFGEVWQMAVELAEIEKEK